MAWLSGFSYRYPLTVTENSGGTLANHQVNEIAITLSGLPVNPYFQYMRVTDSDGTTLLNFWRRAYDNTAKTVTFWVKVPVLTASQNHDIYLYVGNSGGSEVSLYGDGTDTSNSTMVKIVPDSGCKLLLHIDDGADPTADASGNGNNGTLVDSPVWQGADGGKWDGVDQQFSGGSQNHLRFNATNYVDCPNLPALSGATTFFMGAWVKLISYTYLGGILSQFSSTQYDVDLTMNYAPPYGQVMAVVRNGASNSWGRTQNSLSLDTWYLVVMVYNGNGSTNADKLKVYVNSVEQTLDFPYDNIPSTSPTISSHFQVGRYENNRLLDGYVDEVFVYNRLPYAGELDSIYYRRKYASSQPTWVLGDLETPSGVIVPVMFNYYRRLRG